MILMDVVTFMLDNFGLLKSFGDKALLTKLFLE
jgi:hypothetical protein